MKLVFMGTPEIARVCLEKLQTSGLPVSAVYTKPDAPQNRGMKLTESPVKQYARAQGIAVYQPATFRDDAAAEALKALAPDLIVVVAYGKILPKELLDLPTLAAVNVHASL